MPFTEQDLPFSGRSPQPRHASYLGAKDAQPRAGRQIRQYLQLLADHLEGLTDAEAASLMGIERSTINARRNQCGDRVYAEGFRPGRSGVKNTIWKLRTI
jgi:hypothetical protein